MMVYLTLLSYFENWFPFTQTPESCRNFALWVGHVVCMGEKKNAYRVLVGSVKEETERA
jgi:hypothetical protein